MVFRRRYFTTRAALQRTLGQPACSSVSWLYELYLTYNLYYDIRIRPESRRGGGGQRPPPPEKVKKGGLIIADTAKEKPQEGKVITVEESKAAGTVLDLVEGVQFDRGYLSIEEGIVPKAADARGRVVWQWRVGSNTTPGQWPIGVTCQQGEARGGVRTSFEVR